MSGWLTHWPWWAGAIGFATIVLGYWKLMGYPLGASSSYARVMDAARDIETARREVAFADPKALEAALRAATEAEFGSDAVSGSGETEPVAPVRLLPWTAHLTFLVALAVGGFLATVLRNGGHLATADLGPKFGSFFGHGVGAAGVLLGAGVLIGVGTRMGGGCSSGHGLSGCARLQPGSLVGTAAFFGTAVAISLLLERFH
jgi:hypothetical protein